MSTPSRSRTLAWTAFTLGVLLLAGCARQLQPDVTDVSGLVAPLEFTLTNQSGRAVTAADYRGDVVMLYFGYTHCPDACPATLATLADALHMLGPRAARVRVLFVTVDPRRDTLAVLKRYVSDFGPQFVGLRGTTAQLTAMIKRYRVSYRDEKPGKNGNYEVIHSSVVFIFGGRGRARLLAETGFASAAIATDVRRLLERA
jgi:protein SCO1/2